MYFMQSDLFMELNHDFVKSIMDLAVKRKHEAGYTLFRQGDPARHFYVLIKGRIRLDIGEGKHVVSTVNHAGECFGWSALLDREVYSASAECREQSELMVIEAERFTKVIESDPVNGLRFMKRLAGMIGNRLIQNYKMISSMPLADEAQSFGTGQLAESIADIQ